MKTKIISQESNPLLLREEFVMEISSDSTPSIDSIVEDLGKEKDLTVVKKVSTNFGRKIFVADIVVYDSIEAKKKNHVIPQKIRKKMAAEEKARIEEEKKKKEEEAKAAEEAKKAAEEAKAAEESKAEESNEESSEEKTEEKSE